MTDKDKQQEIELVKNEIKKYEQELDKQLKKLKDLKEKQKEFKINS